jgi:preprotein translocase subunit YajC
MGFLGGEIAYAMGAQPGGTGSGGGGPGYFQILFIVAIFAIFYFLLIRPQQKQRKEHQNLLSNLKVGDNVLTSGGIYGKITGLRDDKITLEISDKVRVKVNRGSITSVINQDVLKGD